MVEKLKEQLAKTEAEFKLCEGMLYRLDGAIQTLKHLIAEAEQTPPATDQAEK